MFTSHSWQKLSVGLSLSKYCKTLKFYEHVKFEAILWEINIMSINA